MEVNINILNLINFAQNEGIQWQYTIPCTLFNKMGLQSVKIEL
jgi:hypothetical protein